MPAGAIDIETPPRAGWFMDSRDVNPGDPWQYLPLYTVCQVREWCAPDWEEGTVIFGINIQEIGWAAFARYAGSTSLYLELVWGGLHGIGQRVVVDDQGQVRAESELWIS